MAEGSSETGSGLRAQLEAALERVASLTAENVGLKAAQLISANGYKHVTIESLKDVKPEELEAKAAELEQAGAETERSVLKRVLESKGLSGDELESTVAALAGEPAEDAASGALSRIRAATQLPGRPPASPKEEELKNLHGRDLLKAAFSS